MLNSSSIKIVLIVGAILVLTGAGYAGLRMWQNDGDVKERTIDASQTGVADEVSNSVSPVPVSSSKEGLVDQSVTHEPETQPKIEEQEEKPIEADTSEEKKSVNGPPLDIVIETATIETVDQFLLSGHVKRIEYPEKYKDSILIGSARIILKDGRVFHSAPISAVLSAVKRCGDLCKDVEVIGQ